MPEQERRVVSAPVEARASEKAKSLGGYAARFNSETVIAGLFREIIAPGAFTDALPVSDVRALWNHDPNQLPLGRTSAGTLVLAQDGQGLTYEVMLPDTTLARDLYASVERGDIKESSFAFTVAKDGDDWAYPKGELPVRTIRTVAELFDVSPVTYPAYNTTTVSARAAAAAQTDQAVEAQAERVLAAARLRWAKARSDAA